MNYKLLGSVLLISLIIHGVLGQSLRQTNQAVVAKYQKVKANVVSAKEGFVNAKQNLKESVNNLKTTRNAVTLNQLRVHSISFLNYSCENIIRELEWLKIKVNNSVGLSEEAINNFTNHLDEKISDVELLQAQLNENLTRVEVVQLAREIKNEWQSTQVLLKRVNGRYKLAQTKTLLTKIEQLYNLINDRVELLEAEGVDVSVLQEHLSNLETILENTKENIKNGVDYFNNITNRGQMNRFLNTANRHLNQANNDLKIAYHRLVVIARELKKDAYQINTTGRGWVYAKGNGTAILIGNGTIKALVDNGSVLVSDDNSIVNVIGNGTVTKVDNASTLYEGRGGIKIKGTGLNVEIKGTGITLSAHGRGTAKLNGTGIYRKGKMNYNWTSSGVSVEVAEE